MMSCLCGGAAKVSGDGDVEEIATCASLVPCQSRRSDMRAGMSSQQGEGGGGHMGARGKDGENELCEVIAVVGNVAIGTELREDERCRRLLCIPKAMTSSVSREKRG